MKKELKIPLKNERPEPSGRASANQSQAAGCPTTTSLPVATEALLKPGVILGERIKEVNARK